MSIRALWIVSPSTESKVIYSRRFPTVDSRSRRSLCTKFVPIPNNEDFGKTLLVSVGIDQKFPEFVEWRDSCKLESCLPVVEFKTTNGSLWPLIVIEHYSLLLCCLPFVDDCDVPLLDLPGVSMGCAVLQGISSILGAVPSTLPNQGWPKLLEVDSYLSLSMPLGTPYDTDPVNVKALLSLTSPSAPMPSSDNRKVSPWKPLPFKGRSNLSLSLREFVRSAQWGHSLILSTSYGSLMVRAQLEGLHTDVTLTLDFSAGSPPLTLKSMLFHPCLHNTTLTHPENAEARKLKFRPPLQPFSLCNFAFEPKEPPVGGIYEISSKTRGSNLINIILNLRLSSKVKNSFEFFNVRLPFLNRSPIRHANCAPSWGMIQLAEDKRTLHWNIGQSFPSKSLEVTLTAEVQFENATSSSSSNDSNNSSNSYAQINFVVKDFTLSGCFIDQKKVQISPALKASIETDRELRSTDYKIWNRNEEVPFCTVVCNVD